MSLRAIASIPARDAMAAGLFHAAKEFVNSPSLRHRKTVSELEFPWTEKGTAALLAANRKYLKSWLRANSKTKTMPDSSKASTIPKPLRSAYLRISGRDGKPALVILHDRDDETIEVYHLRPAQLLSLAHDAAALLWAHYDLMERK